MQVDIYRRTETSKSITGEFFIDGSATRQCYEIEPSRFTPVHPGHPCIPAGRYRVIRTMSPHLKYKTPEVLNVPGRLDIRWHIANYPKDILGCSGVGTTVATDFVGNSHAAFTDLMYVLNRAWDNGEEVWVTYHDPEVEKVNAFAAAA
jgi:hypothetical protein